MRISTTWMQQQAVNSMLDRQVDLAATQQQVATGKRILAPSDDPAGSARALDLAHFDATNTQYTRNIDAASGRLAMEEQALAAAGDVLQRVRDLAIQGNNATQTNETRHDIALELRQRLDQMVQIANSRDANGEYLFAGNATRTQPFVQSPAGVAYAGDQGQRRVATAPGETTATGDPGSDVFQLVPTGNGTFAVAAAAGNAGTAVVGATQVSDISAWDGGTYSIQFTAPDTWQVLDGGGATVASGSYAGNGTIAFKGVQVAISGTPAAGDSFQVAPSATRDVFATLRDLADALDTPVANDHDRAALNERVNRALENLDQASGRAVEVRARVGARMNALDQQKTVNAGVGVQVKATLSGIQDLDYASAVSKLNLQLLGLQASQQAFVKVQGLSLFDYLRN
ncbi:MAG: flagellar hook-associated protein FlgL [Mizugakiibacter sp.]|uniref:flagellar hook-associated protein FlgL n=1 Tax=Mizugakiibacter sp. TaxID=1972610 RepID=UPI0031C581A6|nr:flagellar hook-associated protein FlgL [Xanthomonadaceae bacterium]